MTLGRVCFAILTLSLINLGGCSTFPPTYMSSDALNVSPRGPSDARSWMLPEAKTQTLLYVSSWSTNDVYVFRFPKAKLEGTLTGFATPVGLCADSKGNVFIPENSAGDIKEYAHGGTSPIATLADDGYEPVDCAIDQTTGNLAVINALTSSGDAGNVGIYASAQGEATYYSDPYFYHYYSGSYDGEGNLFVVSGDVPSQGLAELPAGSSNFEELTVPFKCCGAVRWDGGYLVADTFDQETNGSVINRLSVSGSKVSVVGSTDLNRGKHKVGVFYYWIAAGKVAAPVNGGHVGLWRYPKGGSPTDFLRGYVGAHGATVSVPQAR